MSVPLNGRKAVPTAFLVRPPVCAPERRLPGLVLLGSTSVLGPLAHSPPSPFLPTQLQEPRASPGPAVVVDVDEQQRPYRTMEGLMMSIPPVVSQPPRVTESDEPHPNRRMRRRTRLTVTAGGIPPRKLAVEPCTQFVGPVAAVSPRASLSEGSRSFLAGFHISCSGTHYNYGTGVSLAKL